MGKKRLVVVAEPTKESISVSSEPSVPSVTKPPIQKKSHVRSAKYRQALTRIDRTKIYPLDEAIKLLKQVSLAKFDASVETHLNLTSSNLKIKVAFPHSTGRKLRVAIADDKLLEQIQAGHIDFDLLLATPAMMPQVAKVAKILGPKGLMPSPKAGTVTADPAKKQAELAGGSRLISGEPKNPLMHVVVGKLSMSDQDLTSNISALVSAVTPKYITKLTLASTMSPGIKVSLAELTPTVVK